MPKILILRGAPGSGKTTYAKTWLAKDTANRVRISRDEIRHMLVDKYWPCDKQLVQDIVTNALYSAMRRKKRHCLG